MFFLGDKEKKKAEIKFVIQIQRIIEALNVSLLHLGIQLSIAERSKSTGDFNEIIGRVNLGGVHNDLLNLIIMKLLVSQYKLGVNLDNCN